MDGYVSLSVPAAAAIRDKQNIYSILRSKPADIICATSTTVVLKFIFVIRLPITSHGSRREYNAVFQLPAGAERVIHFSMVDSTDLLDSQLTLLQARCPVCDRERAQSCLERTIP